MSRRLLRCALLSATLFEPDRSQELLLPVEELQIARASSARLRHLKAEETEGSAAEEEGAEPAEAKEAGEAEASEEAEAEEGEEGEGEEEEKELEEAEEEEEEFTPVDMCVAVMLLGTVSFVVALFQLVNADDDDIRRYSWKTISTTISIFTAILIFTAIEREIESWVEPFELSRLAHLGVQYAHFLAWIGLLQVSIGVASGAFSGDEVEEEMKREVWIINDSMRVDYQTLVDEGRVRNKSGTKSTAYVDGVQVPVMKTKQQFNIRKRNMKTCGTLLAHMAGFAGIHAGGTAQHMECFRASPLKAMIPVVLNVCVIFGVFHSLDILRAKLICGAKGSRHALYDEESEEAENDVVSLALSFLTIQAARFQISGVLPNSLGEEIPDEVHPLRYVQQLFLVGMGCAVGTIVVMWITPRPQGLGEEESEQDQGFTLNRLMDILSNSFSMMFAWCMLFAMRWYFRRQEILEEYHMGVHSMMGRAFMALTVSLVAIGSICFLDKIADNFASAASLITVIINAIAVLVGFSWEHGFDGAVEVISSKTADPTQASLGGACFVAVVIVPIWSRYVLKRYLQLESYQEEKLSIEREKKRGTLLIPVEEKNVYK